MTQRVTFLKPKAKVGPSIEQDGITLLTADASVEEVHERSSVTTDHPVEEGVDITDHIQDQPKTLRMSLVFSATPLVDDLRELNRVENSHRTFWDIMDRRETVDVATSLQFYPGMAITRYQVNKNASTGQVLSVDLDLKQIRKARSSTVPIPEELLESSIAATGKSEENVPTQSTEEAGSSTSSGGASILFGLFG